METIKDSKGESWYSQLLSNITSMSDQLQLASEQRESLRAFIMDVAKAQYCAGNKAGIKWLRIQMNKGDSQPATA